MSPALPKKYIRVLRPNPGGAGLHHAESPDLRGAQSTFLQVALKMDCAKGSACYSESNVAPATVSQMWRQLQ